MSRDLNVARELLVRGYRCFYCELLSPLSLHYSARLQTLVRKRFHVNSRPSSTWKAARIFSLGGPISLVGAVSEPSRFLMNWALIVNCSVHRRPSPTLSRCVSSSHILKLYPSE